MTSTWLPIGIDNVGLFRNVFGNQVSLSSAGIVSSVTAGSGITVTGTASAPIINNAGVLALTSGTGIAISGSLANQTISNTGILSITAGIGIGVSVGQTPTISNSGILAITAGTGISTTGGQSPTLANTGVLSVTAGVGLVSSGPAATPTITNQGILSIVAGSGIASTGGQNPTLSVTGVVTSVTAGNNITLTGTATAPIVNLANAVALTGAGSAIQATTDAQIYVDSTAYLKRDMVTATATGTTVTANGWLVLLTFSAAAFDTSAANPVKVTLSNSKITAGTQAVRMSIVDLNPAVTIVYTTATSLIVAGSCYLWFYQPAGVLGTNTQFNALVEVING